MGIWWIGAVFLGLVAGLASVGAVAQGRDDGEWAVNCYQPDRDLVSRVRKGQCDGEVVSDARAEALRAERALKIKQAMQGLAPGPEGPVRRGRGVAGPYGNSYGIGTGFFIGSSGHAVTNSHVVDDCEAIFIETPDGGRGGADLIARDADVDLALLKSDLAPRSIAVFRGGSAPADGAPVLIAGYPTRTLPVLKPQATKGQYVDHTMRFGTGTLFQMKAAVRPGNSGGPVLDASGRVIGVVVAQVNTPAMFEKTGELIRDVGFGITNQTVFRFLTRHGAPFDRGPGTTSSLDQVFAKARGFVNRVICTHQ